MTLKEHSKITALLESFADTFVGFILVMITSFIYYKTLNVPVTVTEITGLTIILTIVALIRKYVVRRFFVNIFNNKDIRKINNPVSLNWLRRR